jgi:hypothetical protein
MKTNQPKPQPAPLQDMNSEETLDYLRNVSHEDLDDAYVGLCPKCGGKQIYDRSFPRGNRPLQCLNPECEYGPAQSIDVQCLRCAKIRVNHWRNQGYDFCTRLPGDFRVYTGVDLTGDD